MSVDQPSVHVCSPKDVPPEGALMLSVSSRAPVLNPQGWKDLWLLSPFSVVEGGVRVPGLKEARSQTVENAWQFLKIWPDEDAWDCDTAMAAFQSTCAIRYPRGRTTKAIGAYWGGYGAKVGMHIGYVEARKRIYVPLYRELLDKPDRAPLIDLLREVASKQTLWIWDFDSYDINRCGMSDLIEAIDYEPRPFAHAFLVALAIQNRLGELDNILWHDRAKGLHHCSRCGGQWQSPAVLDTVVQTRLAEMVKESTSIQVVRYLHDATAMSLANAKEIVSHVSKRGAICHCCGSKLDGHDVCDCSRCRSLNYLWS